MFLSFLLVIGIGFAGYAGVSAVNSVIKRARRRSTPTHEVRREEVRREEVRSEEIERDLEREEVIEEETKEDLRIEREKDPSEVEVKKMTKREALRILKEKDTKINEDTDRFKKVLSSKLFSLDIVTAKGDRTPGKAYTITNVLFDRWRNQCNKSKENLKKAAKSLNDTEDYESVVNSVKEHKSPEEFIKNYEKIILLISAKVDIYEKFLNDIEKNFKLKEYEKIEDEHIKECMSFIDNIKKFLRFEVENITCNQKSFENKVRLQYATISKEVSHMKRQMSIKKSIQDVIENTKRIDEQKADRTEVLNAVNILKETLKKYDSMMGYDEIKAFADRLDEMNDKYSQEFDTARERITELEEKLANLIDSRVDGITTLPVNLENIEARIEKITLLVKELEDKIGLYDYVALSKKVDEMQEQFGKTIDEKLEAKMEKIKEYIDRSIAAKISKQLESKLKAHDNAVKEKIIEEVLKRIGDEKLALSDEALDKICDKVIESVKITKK